MGSLEKKSFDENNLNHGIIKPIRPSLEIQKQDIKNILKIRNESSRFLFNYSKLIEKHPNIYSNMIKKHPQLSMYISYMENVLDKMTDGDKKISDEDVKAYAIQYNYSATAINNILKKIGNSTLEKVEKSAGNLISDEDLEFEENLFTKEQKEELIQIAKDLYKEIFPEGYVDKSVKYITGQKELEDYQKILLAPANGVEHMIMAVFNLLKIETYEKFYQSGEVIFSLNSNERERLYSLLSFFNDNISNTDKISAIISFIYGIFAFQGAGKIINMLSKRKISKNISKLLLAFGGLAINTEAAADITILGGMMTTRFKEDWINF